MKAALLLVLCVAAAGVAYAAQADPCQGQTIYPWSPVAQPWSTDLTSANPLGYKIGTFGEDNSPPYCTTVTGVQNKKVEVMIESINKDARICVKDTSNPVSVNDPGSLAQCGEGKVHACFPATTNANNMQLVVFCDTGCTTGTVTFWHRIRISNVQWTDNNNDALGNLEMWCMMQDTLNDTAYPSDLMQRDPDIEPVTKTAGASSVQPLLVALPLLAALVAFFR